MTRPSGVNFSRLAETVRQRRRELRMTQEDVQAMGGPSPATLRQIEKGIPIDYRNGTIEPLEDALRWARGSVANVLASGDPTPLAETVGSPDQDVGVLLDMPPEVLEGLDPMEREEVITAAKLSALEKAREIRRRIDG